MDTTLFFTFWGLNAIRKDRLTGKGLMGKMVGLLNRGGIGRLPPSKFNFGGMGRWMFKKMMADKGITPLDELLQTALYARTGFHDVLPIGHATQGKPFPTGQCRVGDFMADL